MDIRFQAGGPAQWKADVMLALACRGEDPACCPEVGAAAPWFTIAPGRRDFDGGKGEMALFHGLPDLALPRVLAVGLGERDKLDLAALRTALAGALARCRELGLTSVLVPVPQLAALPGGLARLVEETVYGALLGLYRFARHRAPRDDEKADPAWLALGFAETSVPDAPHAAARRGERAAEAVALARDLANTPPNILTPQALADAAAGLCREWNMRCAVLEPEELAAIGCNALLAVGQGSAQGPRLIVMEHTPAGHEDAAPLALVGKGLTFDSGGICLKPPQNMHTMKSDMSGAAAVIAAMGAIAAEDMPRRVVAVVPCAENMPGGNAMRPGDVVTTHAGTTVEILNTDAEGRLALCDAISYAQKRYTPSCLVDVATLTGACAVALGQEVAGLFSNDEALAHTLLSHGEMVGEPLWRLPLWQGYDELLKSEVADVAHIGPREGGAINAALFLKRFVGEGVRWAHLDIAGTDWAFKKTPLAPVGAMGFGVRILIELARGGV